MAASTSQTLRMPGEESRELWVPDGKEGWKLAPQERDAAGGILGMECLALDSAPFWSVASQEAAIDPAEMVALHWEAMGVDTSGDGQNWCCWRAGEEQGRALMATMALAAEARQDEWLSLMPDTFEPSARLLPLPQNECTVWKELSRFVIAIMRGDHLLHVAVLNTRNLDREAAREIRDLMLALEARGLLGKLKGCRVWTAAEPDFADELKKLLELKVRVEEKPSPRLPKSPSELLPPVVARARDEQSRRAQLVRLVATIGLACFAFFATWVGWLWFREVRVEKAMAQLQEEEAQMYSVREAQQKWSALELATDPNTYPVEVLYQVARLLPPEGIQLQDFAFDQEKIVVSGMATTAGHALKLQDSIEHNTALQRYTWSFDQPAIKEDNRASFKWVAVLNSGGTSHEGE